jgi:hypothetical protein
VPWQIAVQDTGSTAARPSYSDPWRDIARYNAMLGGDATLDAYVTEARQQRRGAWREACTARAVDDWIRAGFDR